MPTTDRSPALTRRLVLRPGVHVLRRSADELQVGLDPRHALVLPDRPPVRTLLAALTSPASPADEEYDAVTLGLLADAGLLVDADVLLPLIPDRPAARPEVSRASVAALAAQAGDEAATLLDRRRAARIEVRTCGSPEADGIATMLGGLLTDAGVPHQASAEPSGIRRRRDDRAGDGAATPLTGVLVAVGEPAREELDPWLRAGTPHLVLRLVEGHAVLGPFVHPGRTACLRCVDAHHTDVDPAWPLLLMQQATAVARAREDTVPEPVDAVLATLAAAWAARELVSHAEGRPPATASTTIRLDPFLTELETQSWPRHPACGCAWA